MNEFKDVLKPIGVSAGLLVGIPTAANLATGGELFRQIGNKIAKANATPLLDMKPPDLSSVPQVIQDTSGTTNVVDALTYASNTNITPEQVWPVSMLMDAANLAIHWANEIGDITNLGPAAGYGIEAVAGYFILKKLANVVGGVIRG